MIWFFFSWSRDLVMTWSRGVSWWRGLVISWSRDLEGFFRGLVISWSFSKTAQSYCFFLIHANILRKKCDIFVFLAVLAVLGGVLYDFWGKILSAEPHYPRFRAIFSLRRTVEAIFCSGFAPFRDTVIPWCPTNLRTYNRDFCCNSWQSNCSDFWDTKKFLRLSWALTRVKQPSKPCYKEQKAYREIIVPLRLRSRSFERSEKRKVDKRK